MSASSHFASFSNAPAAVGKDGANNSTGVAGGGGGVGGGGGGAERSGSSSGDWSRRTNGNSNTPTTHRRLSLSTTLTHTPSHNSQPPLTPSSSSNVYHPPHHYNRGGVGGTINTTYAKEDLLSLYRSQDHNGTLNKFKDLLLGDVGAGNAGGWGRAGDEMGGAEVCWERDGGLRPVNFEDMTEEEKDLFSINVNSVQKITPNTQNNQGITNHHHGNVTNHTPPPIRPSKTPSGGGTTGAPASRPQPRRRETPDAAVGGSPFASTPPQATRRRTEMREGDERDAGGRDRNSLFGRWGTATGATGSGEEDHGKDKGGEDSSGGGITRNAGLFRRGSAVWAGSNVSGGSGFASNSALNSPMGTFGNGTFGGAMGGFSLQNASGDKGKPGAGAVGSKNSANQPKVDDVDERPEDENSHHTMSDSAEDLREDERERPMTSDTDPFGQDADREDHSRIQDHSPLPTPSLADQQRMKAASPFAINTGSASTPRAGNALATPTKTRSDMGFSGLGGSREGLNTMGGMGMVGLHQQLQNLHMNQQQGHHLHGRSREGSIGGIIGGMNENEPLSPTETNPYQSPAPEKADDEDIREGGVGGGVIGGGLKRDGAGVGASGSDRSGRSSTAGLGNVGGGGLGGFGGLGGGGLWGGGQVGAQGTGLGTSGAPSSFFSGGVLGDLSSPGGLGGSSLLSGGVMNNNVGNIGGNGQFGSASRGSRLGALFPPDQHAEDEQGGFDASDAFGDLRFGPLTATGSRRGFGGAMDSPMRERGDVSDLFGFPTTRSLGNLSAAASGENNLFTRDREDPAVGLHQNQQQPPGNVQSQGQIRPPPGNLPQQPQQHVMVMPDKIQWTYRDPTGTVQGPFSGLEMHDWYKAGFFTQDLMVKRVEDDVYEPLGNLVRKIGNTREPFLVPLQGLPGPLAPTTSGAPASSWSNNLTTPAWLTEPSPAVTTAPPQQGTVQPPFAGSFPSFGTTLTADQQNALERRKQEEQYLMARQREYLVQQQVFAKAQQQTMQQLHHQHSAQSLHSQPSFGSLQGNLQSPGAFAPTATTPVTAGGIGAQNSFEPGALLRQAGAAAGAVDPFGVNNHGGIPGLQTQQLDNQFSQQQVQALHAQQQHQILERQRQMQRISQSQLQQEKQHQLQQAQEQAAAAVALSQKSEQQTDNQNHEGAGSTTTGSNENHEATPASPPTASTSQWNSVPDHERRPFSSDAPKINIPTASSGKDSPAVHRQPTPVASSTTSAWQEVDSTPFVAPFPPPPGVQSGHEPLSIGTAPMTRSSSVETPQTGLSASIAPWAKENESSMAKGPSLKEIQELEAKQAAAVEAAAAEARREFMAQQVTNQPPPPPAPGLPSTATWATSPSVTPSANSASAWTKPLVKTSSLPNAGTKKTLQQIQKEEEARKAKANAAAAAQMASNAVSHPAANAAGKRYADLASKAGQPFSGPIVGGVWTTVGPGGKSKGSTPLPTPPPPLVLASKPVSSAPGPPFGAPAKKPAPVPSPAPKPPVAADANGEFMKWAKASLKGLNSGVQSDDLIQNLLSFPSDPEIIADTIYACSATMDGRRFAEEFIRRRAAAAKGVIIDAGAVTTTNGSAGSWNEVAKGRPAAAAAAAAQAAGSGERTREVSPESNSSFKVVAGKKKGRR